MVEIRNIEVFNLERAQRAIENSFNVGDINTTEGKVKEKLAKSLFGNNSYKQCHNSSSAGAMVQFILTADKDFINILNSFHFLEVSKLKSGNYFITTNFRQLTHIFRSKENYKSNNDFILFVNEILKFNGFAKYCLKEDEL